MMSFLRKLRGALGVAVTWAIVWAAVFFAIGTVVGIVDPSQIEPGEEPIVIARYGGVFGFISGLAFATFLALGEARKKLEGLSLARVALWGALGSAAFPLLTPVADSMVIIFSPIGAALAAGSVAIARRGLSAPAERAALPE